MSKCKIYGKEPTELVLSEKAAKFYAETEPLTIMEWENGLYDISGSLIANDLTAEKVNALLEDFYDVIYGGEAE